MIEILCIAENLKELRRLMDAMKEHSLWQAFHVAAYLAITAYFARYQAKDPKLLKQLTTPAQPEGFFPLHIAVEENHVELVKLLLSLGAKASQIDVPNDASALHYAANSSVAMVDVLCETEEGKSMINTLNKEGYTPVFCAVRNGNPLITRAFIRHGAELGIRCKGRSPLFTALQDSNAARARQVVGSLVEADPEV